MASYRTTSGEIRPRKEISNYPALLRITDNVTGHVHFLAQSAIADLAFNSSLTSATIYLSLGVAGQGNHTVPVHYEVTGTDALFLAQWVSENWEIEVAGTPAP